MSTLRDAIETTFVAAAFAESNLESEARELLNESKTDKKQANASRSKTQAKRPRPTLKA
jgi:hypothetical protein